MAFATKQLPVAGGVPEPEQPTGSFSERTAWVERFTPLRRFVRTETGGAALLIAAVFAGLARANAGSSYHVWETHVDVAVAGQSIRLTLREWVNSGLMTVFYLVVGLEARREFHLGELRERRRLVLPLLAAVGGMAAAARSTSPSTRAGPPPPDG